MSSNKTDLQNRLQWVDYTKGIAIFGILLFHFFQNYPESTQLVTFLGRNGARVGYAAVDLFFVISGFNTSYSLAASGKKNNIEPHKTNWKSWLKKRLSRLYPTYWLAILLTLLIYLFFAKIKINSPLDFGLILVGVPGYERFKTINPGFWFFSVILQAYLVIPLVLSICKSKPMRILLLGIAIGLLTKIAGSQLHQLDFTQTTQIFGFEVKNPYLYLFFLQNNFLGSYFFQLCLGLYWGFVYFNHKSFRKSDFMVATGVFACGLMVYMSMMVSKIDIIYMLGFDMIFTPFFFIGFAGIFEYLSRHKWLGYGLSFLGLAGVYSYQVYLVHQPLIFVLLPYLKETIHGDVSLRLLVSIVTTTVLLTVYVFAFTQLESFLRKVVGKLSSNPV